MLPDARSRPSFGQLMARESPGLDELALALALEFRAADVARVTWILDRLGAELGEACLDAPLDQCDSCRALLCGRLRLRTSKDIAPSLLMLDEVLDGACGRDLAVVIVFCEVGRRAGIPLLPAGEGQRYFVAHAATEPTIVLDPARGGRPASPSELPDGLRWLCPHEIGFSLVTDLGDAFEATGQLEHALTAARLAHGLPLTGCFRSTVDARLRGLQARLN